MKNAICFFLFGVQLNGPRVRRVRVEITRNRVLRRVGFRKDQVLPAPYFCDKVLVSGSFPLVSAPLAGSIVSTCSLTVHNAVGLCTRRAGHLVHPGHIIHILPRMFVVTSWPFSVRESHQKPSRPRIGCRVA